MCHMICKEVHVRHGHERHVNLRYGIGGTSCVVYRLHAEYINAHVQGVSERSQLTPCKVYF